MTLASLVGRRAGLGLAWGSLAVSAVALLAAPARAHVSFLDVTRDAGVVVLSCTDASECSSADDCDGWTCADVNVELSVCIEPPRLLRNEIFCCDTIDDCPMRDNASARSCTPVAGDVSVCTWSTSVPRAYNLCSGSATPTFQSVLACFDTTVSGRLSLAAGDCDGDGILNGVDTEVCTPPIVFPPFDGGTLPIDDLGVDEDLGTDDGGTTTVDQGPASDQGSANPGVAFQGGGGCVVGGLQGSSGAALLLLGAVLLRVRRRRAR